MRKVLVSLFLTTLLLAPVLFNDVSAQTTGYCYIKLVDKHGIPIKYPEVHVQRPGEHYWIFYSGGADGTISIWLRSNQLGQAISISVTDILGRQLQVDKDKIICENFGETETVKVLNSHVVTIKVHDSYYGHEGAPPPMVAVVNSYTSMRRTISFNGEIIALLSDDFEGPLMIGSPLRKTTFVTIVRDKDEYSVLLEPTLSLSATLDNDNLVIKIRWNSVEARDIGGERLIPYSLEILAVSSDGKISLLDKSGPNYIKSSSGEDSVKIPLSLGEEIPPEQIAGALVARVYIDYEIQSSNYWSEVVKFGETSWVRFLVRYMGRYTVDKIPLIEIAFNPFADPSLHEKLTELTEELKSKEIELKNANEKINDLTSEIKEMQDKIKTAQEKLTEYEKKISELEDSLEKEKQKSIDLQSKLDEEKSKLKQAESMVISLTAENVTLKADLKTTRMLLVITAIALVICAVLLVVLQLRRRARKSEPT